MINFRSVRIAVPQTPTSVQLDELNRIIQYGADNGINVTWEIF